MATSTRASNVLPKYKNMHKKPWKYIDYRGFASFVASDDFFILRRFSNLTARVLLALQDELSEPAEQLVIIDTRLSDPLAPDVHNGSFRQETSESRLALIKEVDQRLREYNELVLQHTKLRSRPKVPRKDAQSVANWFHNYPEAILPEETQYLKDHSDLFAMVPKEKAPLRRLLEKLPRFRRWSFWRKTVDSQHSGVIHSSDHKIDIFVSLIHTVIGMTMLIAPLWILAFVEDKVRRLAVITLFLVCFLSLVTFTTVARPYESLGATAAYAAVLVVFLQAAS